MSQRQPQAVAGGSAPAGAVEQAAPAPVALEEPLALLEAELEGERPPLRLGLIIPSSNTVMEPDFYGQLPTWVTVHTARAFLEDVTVEAESRMLDVYVPEAARELATVQPDLVVFGCTSAAALRGLAAEAELVERIGREAGGVRCISVGAAVRQALQRLRARRVWLVAPYIEEVTARVAALLEADGLEVVASASMGLVGNREIGRVRPDAIVQFVRRQQERWGGAGAAADALFVSCTNFQAMAVRRKLESLLGLPVVTSNHAALQAALEFLEGLRGQGPAPQVKR